LCYCAAFSTGVKWNLPYAHQRSLPLLRRRNFLLAFGQARLRESEQPLGVGQSQVDATMAADGTKLVVSEGSVQGDAADVLGERDFFVGIGSDTCVVQIVHVGGEQLGADALDAFRR